MHKDFLGSHVHLSMELPLGPGIYVTCIPSSNLFIGGVLVEKKIILKFVWNHPEVLKYMLPVYHHPICL